MIRFPANDATSTIVREIDLPPSIRLAPYGIPQQDFDGNLFVLDYTDREYI